MLLRGQHVAPPQPMPCAPLVTLSAPPLTIPWPTPPPTLPPTSIVNCPNPPLNLTASLAGSRRIVSTSFDNTVRIWDGADGLAPRLTIRHDNNTGRWVLPFRAVWTPAGDGVIVGAWPCLAGLCRACVGLGFSEWLLPPSCQCC